MPITTSKQYNGALDNQTDGRIRVVTLVDNPDITGGGERMAVTIAMHLDPERFESILCATRSLEGPSFRADLEAAGVRLLTLDRHSKFAFRAWWPLVSLLRRERVDVIHAHKFGSNVWGTILGRLAAVPVVIAHEQSWASARLSRKGPAIRRFLDREVIGRGADAFIAVSRADRSRMIDYEGVNPTRIRVLPNSIPRRQPTGRDIRAELDIPPEAPVVVTVCQLRPEKALEVLVSAASRLHAEFPELAVLVAGDGREEAALREQIRREGVEDVVKLLGTRTDVPDLLAGSDVAVCCSDFEGTPLSVMEYMAAGRAVVATDVGGLGELIEDTVHGLLVPPRDPGALAGAIAKLLRDPEARHRMGARGKDRQGREFDLESMVERVELLYEELVRTSRPRR